jgi:hypothetical protein
MPRVLRPPTVEGLLVPIAGVLGFSWTIGGLSDNTMFVHLRTGMDIVRTHSFPSTDSYSYTAHGHQWVLQSWLTEVIYGALHAVWSTHLIILLNALLLGVIAAGMVRWVRTGDMVKTLLFAFIVLMLSVGNWSDRPTTFGFAMFFTLLATRSIRSAWPSFVIGALWISLHGSWPLGIVWSVFVLIGGFMDTRSVDRVALRRLFAFIGGVVVAGVANPVGWRLLVFPLTAFQKSSIFGNIMEWKSPNFHSGPFLSGGGVLIALALLLIVAIWLRPSWRHALPVIVMVSLSLYSQRNLPFLAIGLASVLGVAWREHELSAGRSSRPTLGKWGPVETLAVVLLALVFIGQIVRTGTTKPYDFSTYPVDALAYAESRGYLAEGHHLFTPDFVGCLRILQKGSAAGVFIDDRYDMYPEPFSRDAFDIKNARQNAQGLLDQFAVDAVLWKRDEPLSAYLSVNPKWHQVWSNKNWLLFSRSQ